MWAGVAEPWELMVHPPQQGVLVPLAIRPRVGLVAGVVARPSRRRPMVEPVGLEVVEVVVVAVGAWDRMEASVARGVPEVWGMRS